MKGRGGAPWAPRGAENQTSRTFKPDLDLNLTPLRHKGRFTEAAISCAVSCLTTMPRVEAGLILIGRRSQAAGFQL